jgi:HAD superfamily hydrolase (TIGR01490 family)
VALALFDFDKTLIATNSGSLFIRSELRAGHINGWQAFRAMAWMAQYHLGFVALESAVARAISSLEGSTEHALRERSTAFYEREVKGLYRPRALEVLEGHRAAGDALVLLTASSSYVSDLVARDLRLAAVLCNRFEVDGGGIYTGRTVGGLCFGAGKLAHAQAYADAQGQTLSDAAFYTDSFSDLPVMLAVGRPVAVNPDQRLRREAVRRGWEIVDWSLP